jgi:hypothetical protein
MWYYHVRIAPGEYVAVEQFVRKTVNSRLDTIGQVNVRIGWPLSPIQKEYTRGFTPLGF